MTLEFRRGMDPDSLEIVRDGKAIGFLQRHKEREPRFMVSCEMTFAEILECVEQFKKFDPHRCVHSVAPTSKLTVEENPMGFSCLPNEADPTYVSEINFERFVAYGLYRCYYDLSMSCFVHYEMVDNSHIQELREAFLSIVEGTLLYFWNGTFEVGQADFDADMFGDGSNTIVGNSDEGDENECMFSWMPFRIDKDQIIFEMYCSVLAGEGTGGEPTTIFLNMEAIQDRQKVRDVIRKARQLNAYPYRTEHEENWESEQWKSVLASD